MIFETFPDAVDVVDTENAPESDLERLIELGLRAQLEPVSLVTGQLAVELAFHRGTEPDIAGSSSPYPEIPTVPTKFALLESQVEAFFSSASADDGIKGLIQNLNDVLDEDNRQNVANILQDLATVSASLRNDSDDVTGLVRRFSELTDNADGAFVDLRQLITTSDDMISWLSEALASREDDVAASLDHFDDSVQSIGRMADQINNAVGESRPGFRGLLGEHALRDRRAGTRPRATRAKAEPDCRRARTRSARLFLPRPIRTGGSDTMTQPFETSEQISMQRRMMLQGLLMATTGAALIGCVGAPAAPSRKFYLGALEQFPENLPKVDWSLGGRATSDRAGAAHQSYRARFRAQRVRLLRRRGVG